MAQNRDSEPNVTYDKVLDTFHTCLYYHLIPLFCLNIFFNIFAAAGIGWYKSD